jgi:hypothetical protein
MDSDASVKKFRNRTGEAVRQISNAGNSESRLHMRGRAPRLDRHGDGDAALIESLPLSLIAMHR